MKYGDGFPVSKDCGRSPCGERGLKCRYSTLSRLRLCRSPCGERGLKFSLLHKSHDSAVAPRAGSVD